MGGPIESRLCVTISCSIAAPEHTSQSIGEKTAHRSVKDRLALNTVSLHFAASDGMPSTESRASCGSDSNKIVCALACLQVYSQGDGYDRSRAAQRNAIDVGFTGPRACSLHACYMDVTQDHQHVKGSWLRPCMALPGLYHSD
jgi:hypothetical protein